MIQQQRELAVRIARGARCGNTLRPVIGQAMLNAGKGILLALTGAWAAQQSFAVFFFKSHRLIQAHS
jgi:hypothetical protein